MEVNQSSQVPIFGDAPPPESALSLEWNLRDEALRVSHALNLSNRSAEPHFVEVGESLQTISLEAERLADGTMESARLIQEEAREGILGQIGSLTTESLDSLHVSKRMISANLLNVEEMIEILGRLSSMTQALGRTARQLRTITISFKIEGSRTAETASVFIGFSQGMAELVGSIFEIADRIQEATLETRAMQMAARQTLRRDASRFSELTTSVEAGVTEAAKRVDDIIGVAGATLRVAADASREIARQVGEVVISLQFNDITRQQIEVTVGGLESLKDSSLNSPISADDSMSLAVANTLLELHACKLNETIGALERTYHNTTNSFYAIMKSSDSLVANAVESRSEAVGSREAKIRLSALADNLQHLNHLLGMSQDLCSRTRDVSVRAASMATRLSHYTKDITRINLQIRLQALNAVINSVHLGDQGRALAVLSQEVASLSGQCSSLICEIIECLDRIASPSRSHDPDGLTQDSLEGEADLRPGFDQAVRGLGQIYEQLDSSSTQAIEDTQNLRQMILEAHTKLDFLPHLIQELQAYHREMELLREPIALHVLPTELAERIRQEHEKSYAAKSGWAAPKSGAGYFGSDTECTGGMNTLDSSNELDLGDNVELF